MTDTQQKVGSKGIRILGAFVIVYLLIGSYLYFFQDLPAIAYVIYGLVSWVGGMMLFYKLHRSYMADIGKDL